MTPAAIPPPVQTIRVPLGMACAATDLHDAAALIVEYRDIPVTHVTGGLAIQHSLTGDGWCIVHVASGQLVSEVYGLKTDAVAVQEALLGVTAVDWTVPAHQLRRLRKAVLAQIQAIVPPLEVAD
jgi:hypothetical protein